MSELSSPYRFCPCCAGTLSWREIGGAPRQVCDDASCGHVFWGNPVPVVAVGAQLIGTYPFARKNEVIMAFHVPAQGEICLNEELAEVRLIAPEKLKPWDYGTGLAVADWLRRRSAG